MSISIQEDYDSTFHTQITLSNTKEIYEIKKRLNSGLPQTSSSAIKINLSGNTTAEALRNCITHANAHLARNSFVNPNDVKKAREIKKVLEYHLRNLEGAVGCGSQATPAQQVWAKTQIAITAKKIDALNAKFGIGPNWALRSLSAIGVTIGAIGIANSGHLTVALNSMYSGVTSAVGSTLSAPGVLLNSTVTLLSSATTGWGTSSLIPAIGTLGTMGVGAAAALTAMYLVKKYLPQSEQQ